MSDSMRPRRRQPTRLLCPWDSPGKNTGVGCHFLLQCMKVKVKSLSRVQLLGTPWTVAHQAPPSMGFSRQEYWSGLPLCPKCLAHIWCSSIICWMSEFLVDKSCRINSVEYNYITSLVKNTFMTFHHLWDLVQHFRFVTGLLTVSSQCLSFPYSHPVSNHSKVIAMFFHTALPLPSNSFSLYYYMANIRHNKPAQNPV